MEQEVFLKIDQQIATIYINRPAKRNAISSPMWKELARLIDQCEADDEVKVIVFRSTDPTSFSAGADITEFISQRSELETAAQYDELLLSIGEKIVNLTKPSIAMIRGFCIGAGCEFAVSCDFRFTDDTGTFAITPAKLGIVYWPSATKHLVDLIGPSNTKDLLYTGRKVNAEEALRMGLVNQIFKPEKLEEETYRFAEMIAVNAQSSVRGTKRIVNALLAGDASRENALVRASYVSEDYQEGVQAFIEKRKPNFK